MRVEADGRMLCVLTTQGRVLGASRAMFDFPTNWILGRQRACAAMSLGHGSYVLSRTCNFRTFKEQSTCDTYDSIPQSYTAAALGSFDILPCAMIPALS
jgi:hypothetical protein